MYSHTDAIRLRQIREVLDYAKRMCAQAFELEKRRAAKVEGRMNRPRRTKAAWIP